MSGQSVKILLIEDELPCAILIKELIHDALGLSFRWTHVQTLEEGLCKLRQEAFKVVLLDLGLPDSLGLNTYTTLQAEFPSVPILVLSGNDNADIALQAVREGAQDYLVKSQLDGRLLARAIRYAIERKRAEEALRGSEQFFRLISENVSDLIAVLDGEGRRLYNSPSYRKLLGEPDSLLGTDSFEEIHPEDRGRIRKIFQQTLATCQGRRTEYRMILKNGAIRHIESQGSVILDEKGKTSKVVVVSRDITERKEATETLRQALSDLQQSHENVKATQKKLIQSEKLEAVSTFAAGVAHEVKNPLQTIILGVDYLSQSPTKDENAAMVLEDMSAAVLRADAIIRGLMEFSGHRKRELKDENLSHIVEEALKAVENELANHPVSLHKDVRMELPLLRLDGRTMKHVFINLLLYSIRSISEGGKLFVRTFVTPLSEPPLLNGKPWAGWKPGDSLVGAEIEDSISVHAGEDAETKSGVKPANAAGGLGLTVLKKIIELYGGMIDVSNQQSHAHKYRILFKVQHGTAL